MSSPLDQAGAVKEPSEYATLSMDRAITGLVTQRNPLRDADVPYVQSKYASRIDSIIDGLNREINARSTMWRSPGSSIYNAETFPPANSFYPYKKINTVSGDETIRVMYDGKDGVIYDATAGGKISVFTKSAGAGKARFQGVASSLYLTDGVENKKWMQPSGWVAQTDIDTTIYNVGTTVIDPTGDLQYLLRSQVGTITNVQVAANAVILTVSGTDFNMVQGITFKPSGLTGASFLNGQLLIASAISPSGSDFTVVATFPHAPYSSTADAGIATTNDVLTPTTTGGSAPAWNASTGGLTTDGFSTWQNFGTPVYDWGPPKAPSNPPDLVRRTVAASSCFWRALSGFVITDLLLAGNGFIQACLKSGRSGTTLPAFRDDPPTNTGFVLSDGAVKWGVCGWLGGGGSGTPTAWRATTAIVASALGVTVGYGDVLVDSNGNVQQVTAGSGSTGATEPTWGVNPGDTVTDSGLTWTNKQPYFGLAFNGWKFGYGFHCIDGSVSTISPLSALSNGVLDGLLARGIGSDNPQVDSVWIFHTADGQTTPLFIASIENPGASATWELTVFWPDSLLNPFIAAPQTSSNNPPLVGMTAPTYHLQRIFAIYKNTVVWSGGPDVLVGNGNTSFRPSNNIPFPEQPIRLVPVTLPNGGILVVCTSNTYVILGTGTASNPFYETMYMEGVGILGYDALTMVGSTLYLMTGKKKCVSLDPGSGYTEYGFPIGDQFENVTTGALIGGVIPSHVVVPSLAQRDAAGIVTLFCLNSPPFWISPSTFINVRCSDTEFDQNDAEIIGTTTGVVIDGVTYYSFTFQSPDHSPDHSSIARKAVNGSVQEYIGPALGSIYDPASTFVTWAEIKSGDTAVYVADGAVGWFRFSPVCSPDSGYAWSPRRAIVGGTSAVQAVETSPGVTQLLIAPLVEGPILFRDGSVHADWYNDAYQPYPSWDVKGNIVLCQSGEVAEIAHIALKSIAVGEKPRVGLLMGEIQPTLAAPFDWLDITSADPPDLQPSETMYSDRYSALQNGVTPKCDNFQLAIDYGSQNEADETLQFSIYGAISAERRQQ